jgi:tRNA (guanine-N7-)-methyltransferase
MFYVVTDVVDYFAVITELLQQHTRLKLLAPGADATRLAFDSKQPTHDLDYLTNFERKFRKEGRSIFRSAYVRCP